MDIQEIIEDHNLTMTNTFFDCESLKKILKKKLVKILSDLTNLKKNSIQITV